MKKKYPDLTEEFRSILFTAYAECPALPTKQYVNYRVVFSMDN